MAFHLHIQGPTRDPEGPRRSRNASFWPVAVVIAVLALFAADRAFNGGALATAAWARVTSAFGRF